MKIVNLLIIGFLFVSCSKTEDKGLLKGNIIGYVESLDELNYKIFDNSGIEVTADNENVHLKTQTDRFGNYSFTDLSYGKYTLSAHKDGFIPTVSNVSHIGGKVPTIYQITMSQIPTYEIHLDSLGSEITQFSHFFYLYGNFNGISKKPQYNALTFRCFIGKSLNVSSENYDVQFCSYCIYSDNKSFTAFIDNSQLQNIATGDSIYLIVYSEAFGQCYKPDFKSFLGKPSNVISYFKAN